MLSTLILCLGSLSIVAGGLVEVEDHWEKFAETFDKEYTPQELGLRKQLLAKSVRKISEHNVNADLGLSSYRLGVNEYSDSSDEEYDRMNGLVSPANATLGGSTFLTPENVPVPDAVDWRKDGYVTGVKNQGSCGSCWAFSSTGVLEGQHYRRYRKLVSLSEQELVDCSRAFGNYGCHGGWTVSAYHYIAQNGGLDGETCYPYENRDAKCRFRRECVLANCTMNHVLIRPGDETALKAAVATVGPISAGIDARHDAFRHYKSGILDIPACTTRLTHYVLIVGYGRENGLDYWLVKNSFGTSWGINGYVKMTRNKNNQCGIASRSTYPLL